ncbi:MAG: DMT family transporter [Oscillospiraceae bacterium]
MPDPGASHAYTRLGRFALIVTTLLWGSSFTIMKDALASVPALWLLAIRFSGAAMLMALIGIRSLRRLDRGYLTGGACMGVCLYLAYTIQTYGLVHTTPGKNAFLAATYCVFVPFFWWLIHKRRPDRYNLAAALLCLCGMGLVSLQSDLRIGRGEGLTILSGVFYALHIIATASAARGCSPVLLSFVQFAVAAVLSWVTAPFAAPAPEEIPPDVWLRLGYLCVMCTGLCFLLQTFGQKYTPPTTAALLLTLEACSARCFPLRSITSIWSCA